MGKSMQELVRLAVEGDQSAIGELYELTYNSVYKTVKLMVKDDDTALDIVQESYIKGFQNLNQLDAPEHFQAWMKTIASNKARDYFRKKKDTLFSEMENEDGDLPEFEDTCIENLPEAVLDREETARLMKEIIDSLSEDQRAVIYMYHYKEMTVQQIAAALECSENTIKSRLRYARNKIKEKVEDLEKKGTKLYSLSPISFFTFLVRMAKMQGLTFSLDGFGKAAAAGTATVVTEAAATVAESAAASSAAATGAAAAGETAAATAGGTATANAAAGAAAKAAGGAASKALATKIVAGTLAATMTVGAGAVAVNNISRQKENEAAHVVYEEMLDRYRTMFSMEEEEQLREEERFWDELLESTLKKYPNHAHETNITKSYIEENANRNFGFSTAQEWHYEHHFEFKWGNELEENIPMPNTVYFPTMSAGQWADEIYWGEENGSSSIYYTVYSPAMSFETYWGEENGSRSRHYTQYYAMHDIDKNGIDDLLLWNKEDSSAREFDLCYIYSVSDGYVYAGEIEVVQNEDGNYDWYMGGNGRGYWWEIDGITYYIGISSDGFMPWVGKVYRAPEIEWNRLIEETEDELQVYEEFLNRYKRAFEMDTSSFRIDYDRFWSEISEDILEQYPEIDLNKTNSVYLDYIPGEYFEKGIPVPDTVFEPNMDSQKLLAWKLEDEDIRFAFIDLNDDGNDELIVAEFYRGELQYSNSIDVYTVKEGKLIRGEVNWGTVLNEDGELQSYWTPETCQEIEYIKPGIVYINLGAECFREWETREEPKLDWQILCSW